MDINSVVNILISIISSQVKYEKNEQNIKYNYIMSKLLV